MNEGLGELRVSKTLFYIIKVSKKAVFFYDDTRNRKSKKANADRMY